MKNNHNKLISLIQEAIKSCSYDDSLSEAKRLLRGALNSASAVGKKRGQRALEQELRDKAAKKQSEWWNTIKDNVGELPEIKEEEQN
jgi:hypothetical protein